MNSAWNSENAPAEAKLFEQVNPVFNTAKMTLFQLASNGDPDAAALVKSMGLTLEGTQNSATTTATPEQVLGGTVMLETRYRTMANLAECSGYTLVDLPCGYTPRAAAFARKGLPYYGLDLPAVIREISTQIPALIPPEKRELVHYREVDATNYESLEKALEDITGKVCINTEGLLMYFTDSEAGVLCDNIRRILEKKGGCWYTADPEAGFQYIIMMRSLVGDRFMEIMMNAKHQAEDKSDVVVGKNVLTLPASADMESGIKKAMAFLAEHGLTAQRIPVAEYLPELQSLAKVSPEKAAAVREGMKRCAYWKITLKETATAAASPASKAKDFGVTASAHNSVLSFALSGRLDTITAPELLQKFNDTKKDNISSITVDLTETEYISSAGLRVMLIMCKSLQDRTRFKVVNYSAAVKEIFDVTGFSDMFGLPAE